MKHKHCKPSTIRVFVYVMGGVITGVPCWSRSVEIHLAASNRKAERVSWETRTLSRGVWLAGCGHWLAASHPVPWASGQPAGYLPEDLYSEMEYGIYSGCSNSAENCPATIDNTLQHSCILTITLSFRSVQFSSFLFGICALLLLLLIVRLNFCLEWDDEEALFLKHSRKNLKEEDNKLNCGNYLSNNNKDGH